MTKLRLVACILIWLSGTVLAAEGSGGHNSQRHLDAAHVVLVSIDGARWDYPDLREARTLRRLATEGVRGERLLPVYPTLTFPNHYSLVTGLYPAHHGIVANDFPLGDGESWYHISRREAVQDGANYRGEPTWVTAEKQGMVSASFFWVGSEADIQEIRPTHFRLFSKTVPPIDRVDQVLSWLGEPPETRPHFITLYFEGLDDYSHWYGAMSGEAREKIREMDRVIERLVEGIDTLPHADRINLIVVSDHGQGNYREPFKPFVLSEWADLDGIAFEDGGAYLSLWIDDPARAVSIRDQVNEQWDHGRAWLKGEAPPAWQVTDDPRFPDVMLVADPGYGVISSPEGANDYHPGDHGWAPEARDMHGIFLARGPAFRQGLSSGPVRNIDVNPLVLHILGLEPPPMDGSLDRMRHVLKVME